MNKILVIQQKMIGDVLVSSILCENLALEFPNATIDYLVYDSTTPVLENKEKTFNVIPFTKKHRESKKELFTLAKQIKSNNYDVIIDAYCKLESWIIVAMSDAKKKISFDKGYINFFYTDLIKRHNTAKTNLGLTIEQRLNLLKPLGIKTPKITHPSLVVNDLEKETTKDFLNKYNINLNNPLVMVSVLGSSLDKTYPLPYMAKILDEIIAFKPMQLLFNYIPNQTEYAKELYNLCNEKTKECIYFEAIGKSLRDFIAIMDSCEFIIGNDGGAINMAKALNKPAFTIYSPIINKEGWNSFEDGNKYISVHLKDYKPNLFENLSSKKIKKLNNQLYLEFKPEYIKPLLLHFLKQNA